MKSIFLSLALLIASLQGEPLRPSVLGPLQERAPFEMGWEKDGARFGFHSDGKSVSLALELPEAIWAGLTLEEQGLFRHVGDERYIYGYSTLPIDPWESAIGIIQRRDAARFGLPLEQSGVDPIQIGLDEITEWIEGKKVLFYTGAGLSLASGIPDMQGLEEKLGVSGPLIDAVAQWLYQPEEIVKGVVSFKEACVKSLPAKGHQALNYLSIMTNQQILTENLDSMHERGGTKPLRVSKRALLQEKSLRSVDAVICIGLSKDDKGFLRWMKEHNRHLRLIAVNLSCPVYLGAEDLWCPADAHDLLDRLATGTLCHQIPFIALNR